MVPRRRNQGDARFPGRHNKNRGGGDSVRDGLTNDSHGPSTLIEPRHQHILDYVDTRGKGKKHRAGISCIQNGNRKESVELNEVGLHETLEAKCSVERRKNQRG